MFTVVGKSKLEGVSKKTGKDYCLMFLHCEFDHDNSVIGLGVERFPCADSDVFDDIAVGDVTEQLYFNRSGYVVGIK